MTTVIETCGVRAAACAAEVTIPLCFLDIWWAHFPSAKSLIFYDHTCSEAEFLDAIVPNLKRSLSLALKRYPPVAGNLLYPLDTQKSKPVIRYVSGDSIPLTVAISAHDFGELTGSHPRDSDQFYEFVPPMPPLTEEADHKIVPLIAFQATLFPGRGICIGLACHHSLADARSATEFMWAWAEINKRRGDDQFLSRNGEPPPLFDRSVFGDCSKVDEKYWKEIRKTPLKPTSFPLPTNRVRASFTLQKSDIEKLKNLVLSKNPDLARVSSFVVTTAYTWCCLARSGAGADAGGKECFVCPVDIRGRRNALVNPPPPANYFGNCIGPEVAILEHAKVATADGGFLAAAVAVAGMIRTQIHDGDNFMKGYENQWSRMAAISSEMRVLRVAGSPQFDMTKADFGWGKGRSFEAVHIDSGNYTMSLYNSNSAGGGLVVGMSLPRERMDLFAAIFQHGLFSFRRAKY